MTVTWLILGLAAVTPRAALGQFLQGTLNGNVTDASQAAIGGAKIVTDGMASLALAAYSGRLSTGPS